MDAVRVRRFFFVAGAVSVLAVALAMDSARCLRILDTKQSVGPTLRATLVSDVDGNSALLGNVVRQQYAADAAFHVARPKNDEWRGYYQFFRVDVMTLTAFAYPVRVRWADYGCFIAQADAESLAARATRSARGHNATCYFIPFSGSESNRNLGLFVFKDMFLVAPMQISPVRPVQEE